MEEAGGSPVPTCDAPSLLHFKGHNPAAGRSQPKGSIWQEEEIFSAEARNMEMSPHPVGEERFRGSTTCEGLWGKALGTPGIVPTAGAPDPQGKPRTDQTEQGHQLQTSLGPASQQVWCSLPHRGRA